LGTGVDVVKAEQVMVDDALDDVEKSKTCQSASGNGPVPGSRVEPGGFSHDDPDGDYRRYPSIEVKNAVPKHVHLARHQIPREKDAGDHRVPL
jgi:hypothetical protein